MGIPNETVLFQEANHLEMCQNIDETDGLFTTICDRVVTSLSTCPNFYIFEPGAMGSPANEIQ